MNTSVFPSAPAGGACLSCGGPTLNGDWVHNGALGWGWRVCRPCSGLRRREDLICAAVAAVHGTNAAETVRAVDPLRAEAIALGSRTFREFARYSPGTATSPMDPWALHSADAAAILAAARKLTEADV
ncbi:hypothetical protein ACFVYG_06540 [Streptomyces sp. NPDC058256]|uniref:hypothetical protein n=1 Tax=Streptomyces sp. NPDC058256 TaxID=3346408 RepID=UPI0036DFA5ED